MPHWRSPRASEIDKKLRDDFRRMLREYGITTQETDPILAVLFRSQAAQLEDIYDQAAESIPLAVLDELMAGLGMPQRCARPAQTVIHLTELEERVRLEEGTQLIGQLESREKLTFALDTTIEASPARISFVAIYQNESLRLHHGTELAKELEDARPSFEAVPAQLGPNSAIFIAIDSVDERHLSNHGLYFELTPESKDLLIYLQREIWCLLDDFGEIRPQGMFRPRPGNAGVIKVEWLQAEHTPHTNGHLLPVGFYGGRVFMFPEIPPQRSFLSAIPKPMVAPLKRIFQVGGQDVLSQPRAWLRIGVPREATTLAEDIVRIVLHCATASNVEVLNETINFSRAGTAVPFGNGGTRARYLVAPLSIKGERGGEYLHESVPTASEQTGRFRFRRDRLEIDPAQTIRGVADNYANVSLLLSNGALANGVNAGAVSTFARRISNHDLQLNNLTVAAGGTDGESFEAATQRFAELLLSRERITTHADLEANVKTFEPKVREVSCQSTLERRPEGLRRVLKVTAKLNRASFMAPDEEARILQHELEDHLQQRALLGLDIRVAIEWE
jgi:hypothetical protein